MVKKLLLTTLRGVSFFGNSIVQYSDIDGFKIENNTISMNFGLNANQQKLVEIVLEFYQQTFEDLLWCPEISTMTILKKTQQLLDKFIQQKNPEIWRQIENHQLQITMVWFNHNWQKKLTVGEHQIPIRLTVDENHQYRFKFELKFRIKSSEIISDNIKKFLNSQTWIGEENKTWKAAYEDVLNAILKHFGNNIKNIVKFSVDPHILQRWEKTLWKEFKNEMWEDQGQWKIGFGLYYHFLNDRHSFSTYIVWIKK